VAEEQLNEEMQNKVLNGYRVAGTIFRTLVEELEERFGKEVAHDIARAAVRRKGLAAGTAAAAVVGKGGLRQVAAAHQRAFAGDHIAELSDTRYLVHDDRCGIVEGWRSAGLSAERIKELADLYCWGDLAYAQAFNPNIKLQFLSRIAEGAPRCRWLYTLDEE